MTLSAQRALLRLPLLLGALALFACTAPPPRETPPPPPAAAAPTEADVELFLRDGDVDAAAGVYNELARTAESPQRGDYLLQAAELLLHNGRAMQARAQLESIDNDLLTPAQSLRKRRLQARAALAGGDAAAALTLLPAEQPEMTLAERAELIALRADILAALGRVAEAARDRMVLEPMLDSGAAIDANQEQIWQLLGQPALLELAALRELAYGEVFRGWVLLAEAVRGARLEQSSVGTAVNRWLGAFPAHPAADSFANRLLDTMFASREYPHQVALLLPLRGRLQGVSEAIRDGFFSAYFSNGLSGGQPDIHVYDVGDDPARMWDVYNLALSDGARFIVGPLSKESVNQLAAAQSLAVPVLSLNYADTQLANGAAAPPPELFQFGLLPEDEASQAAEFIASNGLRRAAAIVPRGPWGQRLIDAFRETFELYGGTLVDHAAYESQNNDFSAPLRRLLSLRLSASRRQTLQRALASELKFEPRRREDIDVIFVAATPKNARLLKPQLSFHRAGDIPVYATSHAFTGARDVRADKDMDGLIYLDIPLLLDPAPRSAALREQISAYWPTSAERYMRLFALGMDAYTLIPKLTQLRDSPDLRLPGQTGELFVGTDRRVHRRLLWGYFEKGEPQPLALPETSPALEISDSGATPAQ